MPRALLPVLTLALILMTSPASAIPTCSAGTMADYFALVDGCRLGAISVADFQYSGYFLLFGGGGGVVPASAVTVTPSLPYGASSLRLTFSSSLWSGVHISYSASADGPWIQEYDLLLIGSGGPAFSSVTANGLYASIDSAPLGFIDPANPLRTARLFDPISSDVIDILGGSADYPFGALNSFAFDVVTPEPATLLLWGTGAAGLGLVRWAQRRRAHEREYKRPVHP